MVTNTPFLGLLCGLVQLLLLQEVVSEESTLVGVVILSRHGVRTPYGPTGGDLTPDSMRLYSNRTYPTSAEEWGVNGTAQLTPHGALALKNMGKWFGTNLRYAELVSSCDSIAVYSDTDTRDVKTAQAFLSGLVPNCANIVINTSIAGPLFNQGQILTPQCNLATEQQTYSLIGGLESNGTVLTNAYREAIDEIQELVACCDPSLCDGKENCTLQTLPVDWVGEFWLATSGPVSTAGYFGSFFLLEALNNMTFAWGNITLDRAVDLNELQVEDYSDVDNWWAARSVASSLGAYIAGSLEQMVTGQNVAGIGQPPTQPFIYLAAHDTNIILLRRLLNIEWLPKGWRHNSPPPGGMLIFELHKRNTTATLPNASPYFVRIFFETATPQQIREGAQFSADHPPSRVPVALPGCTTTNASNGGLDCDYLEFKHIVLSKLKVECVTIGQLNQFVESNTKNPMCGDDGDEPKKVAWWWLLVVGLLSFVVAWGIAFCVVCGFFAKTGGGSVCCPSGGSRENGNDNSRQVRTALMTSHGQP